MPLLPEEPDHDHGLLLLLHNGGGGVGGRGSQLDQDPMRGNLPSSGILMTAYIQFYITYSNNRDIISAISTITKRTVGPVDGGR